MDDSSEAVIAWRQMAGSNYELFFSEYRDGAWSHPTGTGDYVSPADSDGDVDDVPGMRVWTFCSETTSSGV